MGAFLDKPITDKHTEEGADQENNIRYALCAMQGWRIEMEDAHIANLNIPELPGWVFFAILDGHAGNTVADYSAKLLLSAILSTPEFKKLTSNMDNNSIFHHGKDQLPEIEKGIKNGFLIADRWLFDVRVNLFLGISFKTCILYILIVSETLFYLKSLAYL